MKVSIPECFMIAFVAGLIFGLVYEVIRIIRLILNFKAAVFVCDVTFFILAAMFVCKLSEFLGNYVRMYTVMGFAAGIFAYIVTIGRLFNVLESAACIVWRKTLGRLFFKIRDWGIDILNKNRRIVKSIFVKIHQFSENNTKNRSKHLHLADNKRYNDIYTDTIGEGVKTDVIKATVRKSS